MTGDNVKVTVSEDNIPTLHYNSATNEGKMSVRDRRDYDNNTYIDWTRESLLVPNSQYYTNRKFLVIILLSVLVGYTTSFIDLISVVLNDFKKGFCMSKLEKWSLLNPYLTCPSEDWYSWSRLFFGSTGFFSNIIINFPIYFIFAVLFAMIAAYITTKSPFIKQSGIPEIKLILAGLNYNISQYLSLQTLLYKVMGLILVVSSGLWLGKEGPLVHVSCCIFNILYEMIFMNKNEATRRELLSAATATGISVAFNAPIGGVLFVVESMPTFLIPTKIMWNSFVSATIAVVSLSGLHAFTTGKHFFEPNLFDVEFGNFSWLFLEFVPYITLGLLGGIYGCSFTKLHQKFGCPEFKKRIRSKLCQIFKVSDNYGNYLEIFAAIVITTLLNFPLEMTKLPLSSYLKVLFTACPTEKSSTATNFMCLSSDFATATKLIYVTLQGLLLAAYTFGIDLPGGILMPSLVLGATCGRFLGIVFRSFQQALGWDATCTETSCLVSPSSYAVIGAASFMSGVTKLTMSVVVIIFELTGAVSYVLPIMFAVMISKFVNDYLSKQNIYDTWSSENFNRVDLHKGYPNEGKGNGYVNFTNLTDSIKRKLPDVGVKSVMIPLNRTKCICLIPETEYTIRTLLEFINDDSHEGYPVILSFEDPISLGYVTKQSLLNSINDMEPHQLVISFQIENLPTIALSKQLHYEQSFNNLIKIPLQIEKSIFILNEMASLVLILETFEKLNANYLILMDSKFNGTSNVMVGFIDRFILSNIINQDFSMLEDELVATTFANDIESAIENAQLLSLRQERLSIELIT